MNPSKIKSVLFVKRS